LTPAEWDVHFATLERDGFVIIPAFFDGPAREAMAAAQRRVLKTWEEARRMTRPPTARCMSSSRARSSVSTARW
jgi:hypothetical protein